MLLKLWAILPLVINYSFKSNRKDRVLRLPTIKPKESNALFTRVFCKTSDLNLHIFKQKEKGENKTFLKLCEPALPSPSFKKYLNL